jgi:hypothetical protein
VRVVGAAKHDRCGEAVKRCPFCAEEIQAAAIKCKHCGSMLDSGRQQTPAMGIVATVFLGVASILLSLFTFHEWQEWRHPLVAVWLLLLTGSSWFIAAGAIARKQTARDWGVCLSLIVVAFFVAAAAGIRAHSGLLGRMDDTYIALACAIPNASAAVLLLLSGRYFVGEPSTLDNRGRRIAAVSVVAVAGVVLACFMGVLAARAPGI